jgi:type II secretory pathway component GspD/PulD (secretin)
VLDEKLTADQIALLEQRLGQENQASLDPLKGISRQEQDIFVVVLPDQNLVAVRTSDLEALDNIARLIQQMDQPTPEVLLEMKILDLTLGDSFHSLFDATFEDGKNSFGLGNFAAGLSGPTLLYQFIDDHVKANIELLQKDNRVDVLATPLLMASNNRPAQLFIGEERVIVTGVDTNTITSVNGSTTSFIHARTELRNVGNTLRILPKINADRTITLAVQQDTSSVLPKSASLPISDGNGGVVDFPIDSVNTANLSATIVARDGMSIAIGGMIRTTVSNDVQKVPLLGDIPYLGVLFSKELRDRKKTEMVLLITPYIMMAPQEAQKVSDRVTPGLSRHSYFDNGDSAYEYYFGKDDRPWSQPPNPHPGHPRSRLRVPRDSGGP